MRPFGALSLLALGLATGPATAEPVDRPVVLELFTSQGCSSCPPADALLRDIVQTRPDVLGLAFHITYWDRLGWPDPFALPAATERQHGYARISHAGVPYTPQLVVDGMQDMVGSDRRAVMAALAKARPEAATQVRLSEGADGVRIEIGPGQGAGRVLLIGYDPEHTTRVARGENAGRALVEANTVRGLDAAGAWDGKAITLIRPRPVGQKLAVIVQAPNGTILGAARPAL